MYESLKAETDASIKNFIDQALNIRKSIMSMNEKFFEMSCLHDNYWDSTVKPMDNKIKTARTSQQISEKQELELLEKYKMSILEWKSLYEEIYKELVDVIDNQLLELQKRRQQRNNPNRFHKEGASLESSSVASASKLP